jgi:16S rRNA (cytosine1402-N4)-methyltransferase
VTVTQHQPVLPEEVIAGLELRPGQIVVDGTLGGGGHTRLLAERVGESGQVISLDRDPAALERAEGVLRGLPIKLVHSNFCELPEVLTQIGIGQVDAILLDLGMSSDQLCDATRGFSFAADGPLDLRFDPTEGEPAWRLINRLSAEHLADVLFVYGEERFSRRIARAIVERRNENPIRTAGELAELVRWAIPRTAQPPRIDPATRTFQALRIAVNEELKSLEIALRRFPDCLRVGGRMAVISFHSLEDRRVKEAFRDDPRWQPITKKPIQATETEIAQNPRSRSAKLRVAARAS